MGSALNWDEYAIIWARLHGGFDPRHASPAVRGWLRVAYSIAIFLGRLRVRPTVVTVVGALLCVCVPLVATRATQGPIFGAILVVLAAVADTVDGAVAMVTRRTSRLGYVYDSVADRFGEAAWLAAFWLVGAPGLLVVVAGSLSWLHEYVRARAVGAGMKEIGVVTIGERPSRVAIAAFGLFAAGAGGSLQPDLASGTITVAAVVWVFFAFGGLAQLLGAVRRAMGA